jgi:hypothetical protein
MWMETIERAVLLLVIVDQSPRGNLQSRLSGAVDFFFG